MAEEHRDIIVYGTTWCPDCRRAKEFLGEQRIHYHWVDTEKYPASMTLVRKLNQGRRIIPTLIFPDDSTLVEPSNAELATKLELTTRAQHAFHDVILIGAGPAWLAAAIHCGREALETLVIEKDILGGRLASPRPSTTIPALRRTSAARSSPGGWAIKRAGLGPKSFSPNL